MRVRRVNGQERSGRHGDAAERRRGARRSEPPAFFTMPDVQQRRRQRQDCVAPVRDPPDPWIVNLEEAESHEYQRSEEHTSELQSLRHLVCRLLLEKKKNI